MINSTKTNYKNECQSCNNHNGDLGALVYQMCPPIIKELNSTVNYEVKAITTTSGTVYNHPEDLTWDTWNGTATFKAGSSMREGRFIILNGNEIESILVECPGT